LISIAVDNDLVTLGAGQKQDSARMLTISPEIERALTQDHFLRRVHRFFAERTGDPAAQAVLADQQACVAFWRAQFPHPGSANERNLAIRYCYALFCRFVGDADRLSTLADDDAETAMIMRLEQARILNASDFDD
jgi:hypothetical protein